MQVNLAKFSQWVSGIIMHNMHTRSEVDNYIHAAQRIAPIRTTINYTHCHGFNILDRKIRNAHYRADRLSLPQQFNTKLLSNKAVGPGNQKFHDNPPQYGLIQMIIN